MSIVPIGCTMDMSIVSIVYNVHIVQVAHLL